MRNRIITLALSAVLAVLLSGCGSGGDAELEPAGVKQKDVDKQLHQVLKQNHISPLKPGELLDPEKVELGRLLMYDKLLSGNKDISCATCHHSSLNTGDELALSIGTGGSGFGKDRILGEGRARIPRHAPEVFNRGLSEWHTMFWDSRVAVKPGKFKEKWLVTPAGAQLPSGLDSILAAQAMFPVTSRSEMRGDKGDVDVLGEVNELALLEDTDFVPIWDGLIKRILAVPEYAQRFAEVYPEVPQDELGFQHAANAIAAFEIAAWTFVDTPWDRYLAGEKEALSEVEKRGGLLFYGEAKCATCHTGNLFSDQKHHNVGIPQFGPGKGASVPLDMGRFLVTGNAEDLFAFRTPPLRNLTVSAPYMHNGAYDSLEDVIAHYNDVEGALRDFDGSKLEPDLQATLQNDPATLELLTTSLDEEVATPLNLSDAEVQDLIAFLEALTDPSVFDLAKEVPEQVPSGLPVED